MILLSVGTQLPFERLVRAVDLWALAKGRDDVVAQIGPTAYAPRKLRSFDFLDHEAFRKLQADCSVMVSHAGMGSIITALELGKPIIVVARDHLKGEHRNGHQLATLRQFARLPGVFPAYNERELIDLLDRADTLTGSREPVLGAGAPTTFIERLEGYISNPEPPGLLRRWLRRRG